MALVNVEDLSPVMREFVEGLPADKEDCLFTRNGEICGRFNYFGPDEDISLETTPEEEKELLAVIQQGDADAAGKGVSLENVEALHREKCARQKSNGKTCLQSI